MVGLGLAKRVLIGDRIYAMVDATNTEVRLLGFGAYVGDEVPPRPGPFLSAIYGGIKTWEEYDAINKADGIGGVPRPKNPKLALDNGDVVWGMECWWGPESDYERARGDRKEVAVRISELRSTYEGG